MLYRPSWPQTQKQNFFCLPSAGNKGLCHHCPGFNQLLWPLQRHWSCNCSWFKPKTRKHHTQLVLTNAFSTKKCLIDTLVSGRARCTLNCPWTCCTVKSDLETTLLRSNSGSWWGSELISKHTCKTCTVYSFTPGDTIHFSASNSKTLADMHCRHSHV